MRSLLLLLPALLSAQNYDVVLRGGRVMDPESSLDAVRYVGITGKKIAAISMRPLRGKIEIDARGLVVAPGFIDLHSHGQPPKPMATRPWTASPRHWNSKSASRRSASGI
jgi:hypothetical protein